jgi:hypothetical protein
MVPARNEKETWTKNDKWKQQEHKNTKLKSAYEQTVPRQEIEIIFL